MANNENLIPIPGRLHSVATEGHVSGADEIYDDTQQKDQATINSELIAAIGTGSSVDSKIEAAINALDSTKSQEAGADGLALSITEENGKITAISGSIASGTYDAAGSASAAQSAAISAAAIDATTKVNAAKAEIIGNATSACDTLGEAEALISAEASARQSAISNVIGDAATDYNTLGKLEDKIQAEASARESAISAEATRAEAAEEALDGRVDTIEDAVGTGGSVDSRISAAVATETTRAQGVETSLDGRIDTLEENVAYLGDNDGSSVIADFDPQTDTVWKKAQTLSAAEKEQVQQNIGVREWLNTLTGEKYVSVAATDQTTTSNLKALIDTAAGSAGKEQADTIYRVGKWDGSAYNEEYYSDYAWDGSAYVQLNKKSIVGEVFDITEYKAGTKYDNLAAALGTNGENVPQNVKKGGMSVKYVNTDNNYVQWRYMGTSITDADFANVANWQGVDDKPTAGSKNLVTSGGVFSEVNGEIQSDTRTWTNNQNQKISYNFSAGDMLIIQLLADSDFSVNIAFHTSSGYIKFGEISKQNDIVAIKVPNDIVEYTIYYTHTKQGTVTGTINLCVVDDITKLPYRFYKLFNAFNSLPSMQENISNAQEDIIKLSNKSFIKSYQIITNSTQKALVDYIEDLELSVAEELADKEFYIRVFGIYQEKFLMQIWVRSENIYASFSKPVSSLPVDTNYAFEVTYARIKWRVVINTKNISSMGYMNDSDSQIVLNVNNYFSTEIQEPQFKPNLFVLDEAANGKYMSGDGVVAELSSYMMSNYLPVQPNKTYKCSVGIPFINFFNSNKTRTRGLIQYDSPTTFRTRSNEYFVVVSFSGLTFLQKETFIIQKVTDESDELDVSNVGMSVDDNISDGSYSIAKINGYYNGQFKLGNALQNSNFISLSVNDGDKLIATSIVGSYAGKITHLHFYCSCESNFNLTLGIGNIDQRNWGLISRTFVVEVVNGENNIDISQTINENERLFVIANSASTSANAKLYAGDTGIHSESNDGDIAMSQVSGYVAIEYSISGNRILSDSQLATLTQLSEVSSTLNDKIQDIDLGNLFIQSPDNNYFRLTISNEGVLTPVIVPVQGDILIMGNSYDVHGVSQGVWWGDFGMAASRKENDWKHQLLTKLRKNDNLIYSFTKQGITNWESTWNKTDDTVEDIFNYNDTTMPALAGTPNYSMVIIRIGENNTDTNYERVQLRMKNLLQYIRTKVGNDVPIILGGCVKIRTEQNPSFIAAANEVSGVTYVDMTPAGQVTPFAAGLDYRVYGDDNQWHTISESSQASAVAGHPNDMVFAKMAELFYPVVIDKLGI